jgi:hypothetical protein
MPNLPIKKIYVDSRFRTADSISTSNFKIELPNPVTTESDTVFFISDVCVPNVFRTIDKNYNNRIYYAVGVATEVQLGNHCRFTYDYTLHAKELAHRKLYNSRICPNVSQCYIA